MIVALDSVLIQLPMDVLFWLLATVVLVTCSQGVKYDPNWESLDARPLPTWYDEGKLGIFIHWGVFAVPSFVSEWFWWYWKGSKLPEVVNFMKQNYPPDFTYADFAPKFTTEFFVPDKWAEVLAASGAKYVVLTSKHHEGFTNWPSNYSFNWNAGAVGPNRDLVGELAASIRNKTSLKFGLYHSMFEWFNPLYLNDKASGFKTNRFVTGKTLPELYEIVNAYKPEVVWSDGAAGPDTYWQSQKFLAWLYNESPVKDTVVVNDRWGDDCACKHGGYFTCDDRYNPGTKQNHKWENCMTIDKASWGFRRNAPLTDYLSIEEILKTFTETVSCGGNMLMNIGPTHDGLIVPVFEERLRQIGAWLNVNGEAIYSSVPWTHQNDTINPNVWYTSKKGGNGTLVYAIMLSWPDDNVLKLGAPNPTPATKVTWLGYSSSSNIKWAAARNGNGIQIQIPLIPYNKMPCQWAWVFRLENLA